VASYQIWKMIDAMDKEDKMERKNEKEDATLLTRKREHPFDAWAAVTEKGLTDRRGAKQMRQCDANTIDNGTPTILPSTVSTSHKNCCPVRRYSTQMDTSTLQQPTSSSQR
ncbi:hypothetical protein PMAYCL1PPCAC_10201, partial [Pristionchus mayeri]